MLVVFGITYIPKGGGIVCLWLVNLTIKFTGLSLTSSIVENRQLWPKKNLETTENIIGFLLWK